MKTFALFLAMLCAGCAAQKPQDPADAFFADQEISHLDSMIRGARARISNAPEKNPRAKERVIAGAQAELTNFETQKASLESKKE